MSDYTQLFLSQTSFRRLLQVSVPPRFSSLPALRTKESRDQVGDSWGELAWGGGRQPRTQSCSYNVPASLRRPGRVSPLPTHPDTIDNDHWYSNFWKTKKAMNLSTWTKWKFHPIWWTGVKNMSNRISSEFQPTGSGFEMSLNIFTSHSTWRVWSSLHDSPKMELSATPPAFQFLAAEKRITKPPWARLMLLAVCSAQRSSIAVSPRTVRPRKCWKYHDTFLFLWHFLQLGTSQYFYLSLFHLKEYFEQKMFPVSLHFCWHYL